MRWYHLFSPTTEKWLTLLVLAVCFALILYRHIKIAYVALGAAALLIALGVVSPSAALLERIDWDVLAIYWGYGMLAIAFRESQLPALGGGGSSNARRRRPGWSA
jgi:Na+/H+ antiporter NhaD/arsenite permease-like protein